MRSACGLILCLFAAVVSAAGPITLGRSGRTASAEIDAKAPPKAVVLRAFGRIWTGPAAVEAGSARIAVPRVRAPIVFAIVPAGAPRREVGQLVAYPDRDVKWDKKITLYCAATPKWFDQWAEATGLPVEGRTRDNLPRQGVPRRQDGRRALLIVGPELAGKRTAEAVRLTWKLKINILVLDAAWFGASAKDDVEVSPSGLTGELADLSGQVWSAPLRFTAPAGAAPEILNRWAWVSHRGGVLVEQVWQPCVNTCVGPFLENRLIVSYAPWQQQLGRRAVADATFLSLLSAAARPVDNPRWRIPRIVWPVLDRKAKKVRPVLAAAAARPVIFRKVPPPAFVVDLRGRDRPPGETLKKLRSLQGRIDGGNRLLVLGDDRVLETWKWLKIDHEKKKARREGVTWLPDDALPGRPKNRIQLMLELTKLGVPLGRPDQENNHD